eukprot:161656-Chlamydomonas_euryale.AAC.8
MSIHQEEVAKSGSGTCRASEHVSSCSSRSSDIQASGHVQAPRAAEMQPGKAPQRRKIGDLLKHGPAGPRSKAAASAPDLPKSCTSFADVADLFNMGGDGPANAATVHGRVHLPKHNPPAATGMVANAYKEMGAGRQGSPSNKRSKAAASLFEPRLPVVRPMPMSAMGLGMHGDGECSTAPSDANTQASQGNQPLCRQCSSSSTTLGNCSKCGISVDTLSIQQPPSTGLRPSVPESTVQQPPCGEHANMLLQLQLQEQQQQLLLQHEHHRLLLEQIQLQVQMQQQQEGPGGAAVRMLSEHPPPPRPSGGLPLFHEQAPMHMPSAPAVHHVKGDSAAMSTLVVEHVADNKISSRNPCGDGRSTYFTSANGLEMATAQLEPLPAESASGSLRALQGAGLDDEAMARLLPAEHASQLSLLDRAMVAAGWYDDSGSE